MSKPLNARWLILMVYWGFDGNRYVLHGNTKLYLYIRYYANAKLQVVIYKTRCPPPSSL